MGNRKYTDFLSANQANWDSRVKLHKEHEYYNLKDFLENSHALSFKANEHQEIGDVTGKSLLHLQCHFGLDTLSFARLGAKVVGVDFSQEAIESARQIRDQVGLQAQFIQSDIYDLPNRLEEKFDIVFTSIGVLYWLPDVDEWARVVAHFLKPGGLFYYKDGHPFKDILEENSTTGKLEVTYPYFDQDPSRFDDGHTYGSEKTIEDNKTNYQWQHTMGEILNALIKAGLTIVEVHEYPYSTDPLFEGMTQDPSGNWVYRKNQKDLLPLLLMIKATK